MIDNLSLEGAGRRFTFAFHVTGAIHRT